VDVGGTFTDLYAWGENGESRTAKSLTTPAELTDGVFDVLVEAEVDLAEVDLFVHGSTTAINSLIERSFPEPAFLTTEGFKDVVEIGRIHREFLYEPYQQKPQQLSRRRHRWTVRERVRADGTVRERLDEDAVRRCAREIAAAGISNVAIGFVNSYANPEHELRAAELIAEEIPGAMIALSSDIPKFRELGRFTTAIVRAALLPVMGDYFERLERRLRDAGFDGSLCVIKSNGGIVRAEVARERPDELLESGPAGGVAAAGQLCRSLGRSHLVTTDMGGTSFDVCLVENGQGLIRDDYEIAWDMPVITPMLDIRSIGAGGGSIAWIDEGGSLRVGPRSSGSSPGPACYGLGGTEPTVTDANFVLGRLSSSLGGRLELDRKLAEDAIARVAEPLGLDPLVCAEGILEICTESMASAIKMVSVDRGRDPRDFAVVTFGGAGAMHAAAIARSLDIGEIIVPPFAGVASAYGASVMDVRLDAEQTAYGECESLDPDEFEARFAALEEDVRGRLRDHGLADADIGVRRLAGLRYVGQSYEVETPVEGDRLDAAGLERLVTAFHDSHDREHGVRADGSPVAIVNLRVSGEGRLPKPRREAVAPSGSGDGATGTRQVYFDGAWHDARVHDGAALSVGAELAGPAIVQYGETTLVLPLGTKGTMDEAGNAILTVDSIHGESTAMAAAAGEG
jgi:N-methylhydantoinase A